MTRWLMARRWRRSPAPCFDVRWLAPDSQRFSTALASLGPVLCLWTNGPGEVLAGAPDLPALAHPAMLCHACAVTPDGPRESLSLCDAAGIARVRLHLLPDTDYLAWDALLAGANELPGRADAPAGRVDRARRLRFVTRRLGPCDLLCVRTADTAGALSWRTAQQLADAEGVRLSA